MSTVAVARSSSDYDNEIIYCTSGFVGDVMFSHNGANRPEPTTTHMFSRVRQLAAPRAKPAVCDCIWLKSVNIYRQQSRLFH